MLSLLGKWPNTYAFTKAVAENVIERQAADLPIGIFRPAIGESLLIFLNEDSSVWRFEKVTRVPSLP